ncbi:MAG: alpha/beta hydrolase [Clostridia bacterium]|nr:alpha/beta hydrolase [Clostridia bacterium]
MLSYKECLAILADPAKNPVEVINGLPIQIKNVPDAQIQGAADPRYKAHEEYKAAHPREHEKPDLRTYNGIPVGAIRQSMGWPNEDISTRPIETQHLYLPVSEGAVPVRVYIPEEKSDTLRACMIYIHGGGFIGGSIDVVENPCKLLCDVADAVVFNVDYRLAPETAYPGGLHDCYDTVKYVYEHADQWGIDKNKICVAGDSAGGNLAAVCALMDRDEGAHRIAYAGLIYPTVLRTVTGYEDIVPWSLDLYDIQADKELLEEASFAIGAGDETIGYLYMNGKTEQAFDPYISPLMAKDFAGHCKTTIINAEYDFLRPQGEEYGRKLIEAGCDVRLIRYRGINHGSLDMCGTYPQVEDIMREIARDMMSL